MALELVPAATMRQIASIVVSVVSDETKQAAQVHLADIRRALKYLESSVKLAKKPYQEEIKKIDAAAKPLKQDFEKKDHDLEQAILAFNRREQAKIEAANRKKIEKFEKRVEKAEAKAVEQGKPIPVVPIPQLASDVKKTESVGDAKQTIMKIRKWRIRGIDDVSSIPRDDMRVKDVPDSFFILDTSKITKIIKAGGSIPGIESYIDETISIR